MSNAPITLSAAESDLLLAHLMHAGHTEGQERKSVRNYTIALMMLEAGLRVGEVVTLQWPQLYCFGQPAKSITVETLKKKKKSERVIPLSLHIQNAANEMYRLWWSGLDFIPGIFAFCKYPDCGHITTRQVERIIKRAAIAALGRPVHPHALRHTFASRLMRRVNIRTVQELLGHESVTSTQIYTHPNEDDKKNAIASFDAVASMD